MRAFSIVLGYIAIGIWSTGASANCVDGKQIVSTNAGQGAKVEVISDRAETSRMTIEVLVDGILREDGSISVPEAPVYYPYTPKNPQYFVPEAGKVKSFSANFRWSNGDGTGNSHIPERVTTCYLINGAAINFFTGRNDPDPNSVVKFSFVPPQ